eukprot:1147761-Pelagomonas_calceolata.AAC.3
MGGPTRDTAPTPLLLRSGDVVVLGGSARNCFHGACTCAFCFCIKHAFTAGVCGPTLMICMCVCVSEGLRARKEGRQKKMNAHDLFISHYCKMSAVRKSDALCAMKGNKRKGKERRGEERRGEEREGKEREGKKKEEREREGKERKGKERKGKERKGKERKGKERKGKERKGKERKGKERKGKERKGKKRKDYIAVPTFKGNLTKAEKGAQWAA